jgi:ferredoxin
VPDALPRQWAGNYETEPALENKMTHVITDSCTKCLNCTKVCPVDCIHPAEGEDGLDKAPQLCVDPDECIDCGACVAECPSSAILPQEDLPADKKGAVEVNAKYYKR